jgi:hypothetical protein
LYQEGKLTAWYRDLHDKYQKGEVMAWYRDLHNNCTSKENSRHGTGTYITIALGRKTHGIRF